MHYSVIFPIITGLHENYPSLDTSIKGVVLTDGTIKHFDQVPLNDGIETISIEDLMPLFPKEGQMLVNLEGLIKTYRNKLNI